MCGSIFLKGVFRTLFLSRERHHLRENIFTYTRLNLNLFLFPFKNIALLFEANVTLRDCRYSHTQSSGGTFPMLLATMKASDWKGSLDFSTREVLNTNWKGMEKIRLLGRGAKRDGGSDLALQSCQWG